MIQLKNTVTDVCHAKNKALREMAELKVQVVSLTSELRGDKDEYMDDLRKENLNYENDNMRMYTMVHQFNKLNPSLCPGCRSGPKTDPLCKACNHGDPVRRHGLRQRAVQHARDQQPLHLAVGPVALPLRPRQLL